MDRIFESPLPSQKRVIIFNNFIAGSEFCAHCSRENWAFWSCLLELRSQTREFIIFKIISGQRKTKFFQKSHKNQGFQEWRFQTWETGIEQNTKTPTKIPLWKILCRSRLKTNTLFWCICHSIVKYVKTDLQNKTRENLLLITIPCWEGISL